MRRLVAALLVIGSFGCTAGDDDDDGGSGPGALDGEFGGDGTVRVNVAPQAIDDAAGVGVLSDGRVVALGEADATGNFDFDLAVAVLGADGSRDDGFADEGILRLDLGSDDDAACQVLEDGSALFIVGSTDVASDRRVAITKVDAATGAPDNSFGSGGVLITSMNALFIGCGHPAALRSGGGLLVGGDDTFDGVLGAFLADGSPDPSFGIAGQIALPDFDAVWAIEEMTDAATIVAGGNFDLSLARLLPAGTLDTSFGVSGVVTANLLGNFEAAVDIEPLAGGDFLVLVDSYDGSASAQVGYALVARYGADGTLDSSFGTGGFVTIAGGENESFSPLSLAVQTDGKILVSMQTQFEDGEEFETGTSLVRLDAAGAIDPTFGDEGFADTGSEVNAYGAMALQADGRIVLTGITDNGTDPGFGVSRRLP